MGNLHMPPPERYALIPPNPRTLIRSVGCRRARMAVNSDGVGGKG